MIKLSKYALGIGILLMFFAVSLYGSESGAKPQKRKLNYSYAINQQLKNYPVKVYPVRFNLDKDGKYLVDKRIPIKTPLELQKLKDSIHTKEGQELKSKEFKDLQGKSIEVIDRVDKEISKSVPGVLGILTDSLFEVPRKFIKDVKLDNEHGRIKIGDLNVPEVVGENLAKNLKDKFYKMADNLETNDFMADFVLGRFANVIKSSKVDIKNGKVVFEPTLKESFSKNLGGYKININGKLDLTKGLIHPSLSIGIAPGSKTNFPLNIKVNFDDKGKRFAWNGATVEVKNIKVDFYSNGRRFACKSVTFKMKKDSNSYNIALYPENKKVEFSLKFSL